MLMMTFNSLNFCQLNHGYCGLIKPLHFFHHLATNDDRQSSAAVRMPLSPLATPLSLRGFGALVDAVGQALKWQKCIEVMRQMGERQVDGTVGHASFFGGRGLVGWMARVR